MRINARLLCLMLTIEECQYDTLCAQRRPVQVIIRPSLQLCRHVSLTNIRKEDLVLVDAGGVGTS